MNENNSVWMFTSEGLTELSCLTLFHTRFQRMCMGRDPAKLLLWWHAAPERRILGLETLRLCKLFRVHLLLLCLRARLYVEPRKCCRAVRITVQSWHNWKPEVIAFISHTTSVSSCHLHQLYQPNKMRKISPYRSTIASWGFLKIQRSWFSIARWVASSHLCLRVFLVRLFQYVTSV